MSVLAILLILLIPIVTLCLESARLTPLVVTSLYLTPILFGYAELDARNDTHTSLLYCAAASCFIVGYLTHEKFRHRRRALIASSDRLHSPSRTAPGLRLFGWIVVMLTAYHFVVAGVPLFSADIETSRFDFTSSGLLGIPGRMFLFGLPFTVLLVTVASGGKLLQVSRAFVIFAWCAYAAANLLGGFKGGLVSVLTTMLLARSITSRPLSLRRMVVGWRIVVIVIALLYGGVISLRYRSLGLNSPADVVPYLAARATVSAAEPGYLVFARFGTDGTGGELFTQDTKYFLTKYLPFLPLEQSVAFPFEKTISAALSRTPISSTAFIVPVTIGAFPELVANLGIGIALSGMFLIGVVLSHLVSRAQRCTTALKGALFALAVYFLQIYILNGDLVYSFLNLSLMGVLLLLLYGVCQCPWMSFGAIEPRRFHARPRVAPAIPAAPLGDKP